MRMRASLWLLAATVPAFFAVPALAQDVLSFESEQGTVSLLQDGNIAYDKVEEGDPDAPPPNSLSVELEDVPKQAVNDPSPENGNNITILGVNGGGQSSAESIGLDGGMLLDDGLLSMTGPGAIANSYKVDVAKTTNEGLFGADGPSPTSEYSAFTGEISSSISTGDFGSIGDAAGFSQGQGTGAGDILNGFNLP